MLSETQRPASPLVDRLVRQLMNEETRQNANERRSIHRTPFFRPVLITLRSDEDVVIRGFSRNVSAMGIGIVSDLNFAEGTVATLKIHSLEKEPAQLISECRWSGRFGDGWFVSGWHFINVLRE